jgi:ribosomal-protein-alanine N-acetyltransferase
LEFAGLNLIYQMTDSPSSRELQSIEVRALLETERFFLRELTVEDASERYLDWLEEPEARKWIVAAASAQRLCDLRAYIVDRIGRSDVLFLGIFEKSEGIHVGNIKYEPVDSIAGYAVMGVLIGDPAYRGKGVVAEVLLASAKWLALHRQIRQILLGVDKENKSAIRAYQKIGFSFADTPYIRKANARVDTMIWEIVD